MLRTIYCNQAILRASGSGGWPTSLSGGRSFFIPEQLLPTLHRLTERPEPVWADVGVKLKSVTPAIATRAFSLSRATILLIAAFAIAYPGFAYYGHSAHGEAGVWAATVAAVVCLGAGLVALTFFALFREPLQAFNGVGLAMLFRMAIPMAVGVVLTKLGGPLAEAGLFGMIVGFYLVGLLVETLLAVRLVNGFREEEQVSKVA